MIAAWLLAHCGHMYTTTPAPRAAPITTDIDSHRRRGLWRSRWAAIGAAVAVTFGGGQPQFRNGKWTFLLDGRVLEWFFGALTEGHRLHVDHLRMEAVPDGDGLRIRWGVEVKGLIVNGGSMDVPAENVTAFQDFIALALATRTPD